MITVDISINANRIHRLTAVNVGPEPGEDPDIGLCRYRVDARAVELDDTPDAQVTYEVLHHRSHGALRLANAMITALLAEVTA